MIRPLPPGWTRPVEAAEIPHMRDLARPAPAPARYAQCDETCTVDCGHCKGAGRPALDGTRG